MIKVDIESVKLKEIEEALGALKNKAPTVLKKSVNETSKDILKDLKSEIRNKYIIKLKDVNEGIFLKGKSSTIKPEVHIIAKGEQFELKDFKLAPKAYNPRRKTAIKGQVKKEGSPKALVNSKGIKAFIIKFKNGHETAVQRREQGAGARKKTKLGDRYVKKLLGPSMPYMVNPIMKEKEGEYSSILQKKVKEHIKELAEG